MSIARSQNAVRSEEPILRIHISPPRALCAALGLLTGLSFGVAASAGESKTAHVTPACHAAQLYVKAAMEGRHSGISDLFADDIDYTGPDGLQRHHRSELDALGAKYMGRMRAPPIMGIQNLVPVAPDVCLLRFSMQDRTTKQVTPVAIDYFRVNKEGKVVEFKPYILTSTFPRILTVLGIDEAPK